MPPPPLLRAAMQPADRPKAYQRSEGNPRVNNEEPPKGVPNSVGLRARVRWLVTRYARTPDASGKSITYELMHPSCEVIKHLDSLKI